MTKSAAVTVGTTPTRLDTAVEATSPGSSDAVSGQGIAVYNNGGVTVYVGGSDVTTANGYPVPAGAAGPTVDLAKLTDALYDVVAAGTAEVRVLEVGV